MVDVGATAPVLSPARRDSRAHRMHEAATITVTAADETALRSYADFCRTAIYGPCQHPVWVRSWIAATGADVLIITLRQGGRPLLMLALEVVRTGSLRIARFIGGNHANGNFAAMDRDAPAVAPDRAVLTAALRKARPDIDLVLLSRQNPDFEGFGNPLSGLATMQSPNISLAIDLAGGFDAVLSRHNAGRKRKRFNYQLNRFKRAGGHRLIEARTPEEARRLIDRFFELKGASLRGKGIVDPFAAPEIRAFFRTLFCEALAEDEPPFLMHSVEIGGEIIAINGLSITRNTVVCDFGTYSNADPKASPGYFIDYTNIAQACEQGKAIYDFSVGDEDYKRSWCDIETWQFETLLPLSPAGHARALYERARAAGVHRLKSNHALWAFTKRLRARFGGDRE